MQQKVQRKQETKTVTAVVYAYTLSVDLPEYGCLVYMQYLTLEVPSKGLIHVSISPNRHKVVNAVFVTADGTQKGVNDVIQDLYAKCGHIISVDFLVQIVETIFRVKCEGVDIVENVTVMADELLCKIDRIV